jgi:hypothetical protein
MLRAVGHPAVVNPDAGLRALALDGDWEILRLDRLGQKLTIAGVLAIAGTASAATAAVIMRSGAHIELPRPRISRPMRRRAA